MNFFRAITMMTMFGLLHSTPAFADQWYEDTPARVTNVSDSACDVMMSGLTKWFVIKEPFSFQGHPATGKIFAVRSPNNNSSNSGDFVILEKHSLSPSDGKVLAGDYANVAANHVPYVLQLGAAIFPPAIGTGLTLLDMLISSGASTSTANDLAVLMPSGGDLTRSYAVVNNSDGKSWLLLQITFGTSVNGEHRDYVVCASGYALKS